jgi:hypothetical protein
MKMSVKYFPVALLLVCSVICIQAVSHSKTAGRYLKTDSTIPEPTLCNHVKAVGADANYSLKIHELMALDSLCLYGEESSDYRVLNFHVVTMPDKEDHMSWIECSGNTFNTTVKKFFSGLYRGNAVLIDGIRLVNKKTGVVEQAPGIYIELK